MQDNKKLPSFPITEQGYVNSKMKKKYEEIEARNKKVIKLKKKGE